MRVQKSHAAKFSHEMRRLWKGDRADASADSIACLEQAYVQLRPLLTQSPRGVGAGSARADDRNIDVRRSIGARRTCRDRQRRRRADEFAS